MRFMLALILSTLAATCLAKPDHARSIVVEYVSVYDGDTVVVRLQSLPEPLDRLRIRIEGIDTPEIKRGARCPEEEARGMAAKQYLEDLLKSSQELRVYGFEWDKYGGRLLGELRVPSGSVRELMIQSEYAAPYSGEGQRIDWCKALQ